MGLKEEAIKLAGFASDLRSGDSAVFVVNPAFQGQEGMIMEGANAILNDEGENGLSFSSSTAGSIRVDRA